MKEVNNIIQRKEMMDELVEVWETAVRATHNFLSDTDIASIKKYVPEAICKVQHLYTISDDAGILGFIGIEDDKIEMLFIKSSVRGSGIGKHLVQFAVNELGAKYVDVNEQNNQAVGFYKHMGFVVESRSELDEQGLPYPILHMRM